MEQPEDKATDQWLAEQKPTTRYTYKTIFKHFIEYVKMNGDQILASRKNDTTREWESKVEQFNTMMREKKSSTYVRSMMGAIRSFFEFHYVPLVFRTNTARKLVEASRKTKDYLFTKEELYKMYESGDLVDKYIIAVGKSFGLRAIDFIALTRKDLEPYIDREPPISIGEVNTIKENVKAYPFLDNDAVKIVKLMLEKLNAEGRTSPDDRILTFEKKMLSYRLQNLAKKIGINPNGRIIRFHAMRKFLFDRLTSVTSDTKAKMIVGKAISEGAYVSPELLREDYKRVMPMTAFNNNGAASTRVTELEAIIKDQGAKIKMYEDILKNLVQDKIDEEDKAKIEHLMPTRQGLDVPIPKASKKNEYWRKALAALEEKEGE